MKIYIFTLVLLILPTFIAHSQTYFDYSLDKNLISQDGVVEVDLYFDIPKQSQNQFLVRPVLDNGLMYIYSSKTQSWINSGDLWTNMPELSEKVKIKIASTSFEKVSLKFVLKNTYTEKEYETLAKPIWGKKIYKNYIGAINDSVSVSRVSAAGYTSSESAGEEVSGSPLATITGGLIFIAFGATSVFFLKRKTLMSIN